MIFKITSSLRWSYLQMIVPSIGKSAKKMTTKPYSVISNAFLHGPLTGWWISTSKSVRFCQSQQSASLGYMNTSFSMRSSQGSTSTSILGSRSHPTFVGINTAKPSETKLAVPWASFVEHYHHALRKWRPGLILHLFAPSWNKHGTPTKSLLFMGWRLEHIQKSAARFVCSDYRNSTSSSSLVSSLKWDCLHTRRLLTQCTLFLKIQNQLVATPFPPIVSSATYYGRYDHNLKYVVPAATIDVYKFSFFPRVIRIWNHLPAQAVNTKGTDNFKEAALPVLRLMQPPVGSSIL